MHWSEKHRALERRIERLPILGRIVGEGETVRITPGKRVEVVSAKIKIADRTQINLYALGELFDKGFLLEDTYPVLVLGKISVKHDPRPEEYLAIIPSVPASPEEEPIYRIWTIPVDKIQDFTTTTDQTQPCVIDNRFGDEDYVRYFKRLELKSAGLR